MSLLTLLLFGAAIYFLWFHKFVLPDGKEVKGWLAKNKAENERNKRVAALSDMLQPVDEEEPEEEEDEEDEDEEQDDDLADFEPGEEEEEEPHERRYGVELNIESTPDDFRDVLEEANEDIFGVGWDRMQAYYGWLMLGSTRHDLINNTTVWFMMSDAYNSNKEVMEEYYRKEAEAGEARPDAAQIFPAWFANAHLLNGFNIFLKNVENCFEPEKYKQIEERLDKWREDLCEARDRVPAGEGKNVYDEPNATEFLVRLYMILDGRDDDELEDTIDMFKDLYGFDFELPEVK